MTYTVHLHNALSIAVIAAEALVAVWLVTAPMQFLWIVEVMK